MRPLQFGGIDEIAARCGFDTRDQRIYERPFSPTQVGAWVGDQKDINRRRAGVWRQLPQQLCAHVTLDRVDGQRADSQTGHDHAPNLLEIR